MGLTIRSAVRWAAAALLFVGQASAQRPGANVPGVTPGGNNPGSTRGGNPSGSNPPTSTDPNLNPPPQAIRPLILYGRIAMDDGGSVPRDVAIERFCGGNLRI